jgi:hypothetical protein
LRQKKKKGEKHVVAKIINNFEIIRDVTKQKRIRTPKKDIYS